MYTYIGEDWVYKNLVPPTYQAWIPYNPARFVKDWQANG